MCQILAAANGGGVTRTKITNKAYLTFLQVKKFLIDLTERNLVQYESHTQTFRITEKGLRLLNAYNQLGEFIRK
jgi:predicted transcriptional regulator